VRRTCGKHAALMTSSMLAPASTNTSRSTALPRWQKMKDTTSCVAMFVPCTDSGPGAARVRAGRSLRDGVRARAPSVALARRRLQLAH
jgi:hypothetical protein